MTIHLSAFVHPLAYVEEGCTICAGATLWQFASISRFAVIGPDAIVSPGAMIDGSRIGGRSKIGPGVKMGPGFLIGNSCFIGPNVVLCNDLFPRADVDSFDIQRLLDGMVTIWMRDGASIGANATILPGVVLGERSMVAANAVCDRNVPPDHIFKRDGTIVPIQPKMEYRRMKEAHQ